MSEHALRVRDSHASGTARTKRALPGKPVDKPATDTKRPDAEPKHRFAPTEAGRQHPADWEQQLQLAVQRGPGEEVPWSSALEMLREILQADYTAIVLRRPSPRTPALIIDAFTGGVQARHLDYAYYSVYSTDPFSEMPDGQVVTVDEALGTEAWESSPFYQRYVKPYNVRYILGTDLVTAGGAKCRLRISRSAERGDFGPREHAICTALLPCLKIAIDLHVQMEAQRAELGMYARAMEQLLIGVAVFNEDGTLVHTNKTADEILAAADGMHLAHGGLHAAIASEDRELQRAFQEALKDATSFEHLAGKMLSLTRPSGRSKIGVLMRPIPLGAASQRPAVAMFLRDPDQCVRTSIDAMRELFGFTKAEAILAAHLANGCSLDEAADTLCIKRNTVRAQLRSIFAKTGVSRQSMLVRLLLSSISTLSEPKN